MIERILTRQEEVQAARKSAEEKLLETKAIETEWHLKQTEMDNALKPFSPPALRAKLETLASESEVLSETLATSFLEGEEGDIAEFVREFRSLRKVYHVRRIRKEKWQQGQVAGWR